MARGTKSKTVLKLVILAIALQETGGGAVAPAMADIIAANPDYATTTLMLIQTAPYGAAMIMAPVYGFLSRKVKKRSVALAAILMFIIFGVAPYFFPHSMGAIIFCRVMFGVATGLLIPLAFGLCTDFFEGKERTMMIGLVQAAACIGGIFFQTLGGYLATLGWNFVFLAYLISVVILLFAFFALPEPKYVDETEAYKKRKEELAALSFKEKFPPIVIAYYAEVVLFMITILILINNLAIYITAEGWGGSVEVGYILSAHSVCGFIGGLVFAAFCKLTKKWNITVAVGLAALCFALMWFANNLWMAAAGAALVGFLPTFILSGTWDKISNTVVPIFATSAVAVGVACQNLGQFVEPYYLEGINTIFGLTLGRDAFMVATITCLVLFVILVIQTAAERDRGTMESIAVLEEDMSPM